MIISLKWTSSRSIHCTRISKVVFVLVVVVVEDNDDDDDAATVAIIISRFSSSRFCLSIDGIDARDNIIVVLLWLPISPSSVTTTSTCTSSFTA